MCAYRACVCVREREVVIFVAGWEGRGRGGGTFHILKGLEFRIQVWKRERVVVVVVWGQGERGGVTFHIFKGLESLIEALRLRSCCLAALYLFWFFKSHGWIMSLVYISSWLWNIYESRTNVYESRTWHRRVRRAARDDVLVMNTCIWVTNSYISHKLLFTSHEVMCAFV